MRFQELLDSLPIGAFIVFAIGTTYLRAGYLPDVEASPPVLVPLQLTAAGLLSVDPVGRSVSPVDHRSLHTSDCGPAR